VTGGFLPAGTAHVDGKPGVADHTLQGLGRDPGDPGSVTVDRSYPVASPESDSTTDLHVEWVQAGQIQAGVPVPRLQPDEDEPIRVEAVGAGQDVLAMLQEPQGRILPA